MLPASARQMLINAARKNPQDARGESLERQKEIEDVIRYLRSKYPECFREEEKT